jgi:hypothetical protein
VALTMNERAAVAVFAVRLQTKHIMPHSDKINLCCNIVEQTRAGATPKEICQTLRDVKPQIVYKVISRATPCWPAACVQANPDWQGAVACHPIETWLHVYAGAGLRR